jgi:hypothetical protein
MTIYTGTMRLGTSLTVALFFIVAGSHEATRADSCPYQAQAQEAGDRADKLVATIWKTGDCSNLPAFFAALKEHNQAIDNAVRNCRGVKLTKQADPSAAGRLQAALQDHCKKMQDAAAPSPTSPKPPASNPNTASTPLNRQSVSCNSSDITGTGTKSIPPASVQHCQDGNIFLKAAQLNRQGDKPQAARQYRRAAQEFHLAGDDVQADAANHAADLLEKGAGEFLEKKQNPDATHQADIARQIEKGAYEDGSCDDLEVAADRYDDAMKGFIDSNDFDQAIVNMDAEKRVRDLVSGFRKAGKCKRKYTRNQFPHGIPGNHNAANPDDPKKCKAQVDHLKNVAETIRRPYKEWTDASGMKHAEQVVSAKDQDNLNTLEVMRVELAARGCPRQKDEPKLACELASRTWAQTGKTPDTINAYLIDSGCRSLPPITNERGQGG